MSLIFTFFVFLICYSLSFLYINKVIKVSFIDLFVIFFIIGLRFFLSSIYELSFPPLIGGMSIISIHTLLSLLLMFVFIPKYYFKYSQYKLFYFYLVLMITSSLYNNILLTSVSDILKFLYLLLLMMVLLRMSKKQSVENILISIFVLILPVIILQVLSIIFGYAKDTEADGSISYIGTYSHEAVFSFVCLIGIYTSSYLYSLTSKNIWIFSVVLLLLSIYLANYRTSILATLPVISFLIYSFVIRRFSYKVTLVFKILSFLIISFVFYSIIYSDRFSDIVLIFKVFDVYMLDPAYYDRDAIQIFSGRLYFWAQFYQEYLEATPVQQIIGSGPSAYVFWADKYAHNQFISIIYELGIVGLLLFTMILSSPLINYYEGNRSFLSKISIFSLAGMTLLCLGTMPLWSIEGSICFSIIFMMFNKYNIKGVC